MTLLEKSLFGAIEKQNAAGAFLSGVLLIITLNLNLLPRFIPTEEHMTVNRYVAGSRIFTRQVNPWRFFYARKGDF